MNEQLNNSFSNTTLGIVCPMANEKNTVREFISAVLEKCQGFKKVTFFAILDNMSKDGTIGIIKDLDQEWPQLKFIWAPENRCVVDAYMRGYQEAMKADCNWILEIDAGFSHQPSEISRFFVEMSRGYDCVFGSRFCKGGKFKNFTLRRFLISKGGTLLTNLMLGTKLKDMTSGFELFSHATMQMILDKGIQSRGHFFQTEIRVFCRNLNIIEIPISYSNPSYSVDFFVIKDAFSNLWRLFKLRLRGQL